MAYQFFYHDRKTDARYELHAETKEEMARLLEIIGFDTSTGELKGYGRLTSEDNVTRYDSNSEDNTD